jgi:hypothetical protein
LQEFRKVFVNLIRHMSRTRGAEFGKDASRATTELAPRGAALAVLAPITSLAVRTDRSDGSST